MNEDELARAMMARALKEARKGRPSPNPHVGAVIAHGERIVGVGHHERAGEDHAEIAALIAAGASARGATLYCTLEPCNHFGRTPPCTEAILASKIARVVVGCADPKPHIPGGMARLVKAGVEVVTGVREEECLALIADFARLRTTGLPYAILKAAVTLDGRIAARTGDSRWITGERARKEAHRMRARADAVLVGIGTVLADDPALTVRHVAGANPVRVVLDRQLRVPDGARVLSDDAPTLVVHGPDAPKRSIAATLVEAPLDPAGRLDLRAVLDLLAARDVMRLLVEGGAKVHGAFLASRLAQRAAIFVAPRILADASAIPLADAGPRERMADAFRLSSPSVRRLGDDVLIEGDLTH
jgi:diaminohydroxyphosphoribosylaminopyrimidine deaminase/5-amino-6-(5-phosphoribosylamino)uracil reductase